SIQLSCRWSGGYVRLAASNSLGVGSVGGRRGLIRIELPLPVLQGMQAVTMFDQEVWPPRDRGITCSNVGAEDANVSPQYWHVNRSRRNTLNRVNATRRAAGRYLRSATTDGSRILVEGLRTQVSYSATIETRSLNTACTASSQRSRESGK